MKPKIIALMGADGAGKSTIARALKSELDRTGRPSVVTWATLRPVLSRPAIKLAKFLFVRKHDKFTDYTAHIEAKQAGLRKLRWAHEIFLILMVLDYLPQAFFKVVVPWWRGRYVICDRYYYDLMLEYTEISKGSTDRMVRLVRAMSRLLPGPHLSFFVDVPVEVALARKRDIPSARYLEAKGDLYRRLARALGLTSLDGTSPPQANCALIMNDLEKQET
jgi:dTMP kinase